MGGVHVLKKRLSNRFVGKFNRECLGASTKYGIYESIFRTPLTKNVTVFQLILR